MFKSEPVLQTTQVDHRLLEFLRLFMVNFKDMNTFQREIMFRAIHDLTQRPSPIEEEYVKKEMGKE